jgi:hypothetical protein
VSQAFLDSAYCTNVEIREFPRPEREDPSGHAVSLRVGASRVAEKPAVPPWRGKDYRAALCWIGCTEGVVQAHPGRAATTHRRPSACSRARLAPGERDAMQPVYRHPRYPRSGALHRTRGRAPPNTAVDRRRFRGAAGRAQDRQELLALVPP